MIFDWPGTGSILKLAQLAPWANFKVHVLKDFTMINTKNKNVKIVSLQNIDAILAGQKGLFNFSPDCIVDGDFLLPNEIDG